MDQVDILINGIAGFLNAHGIQILFLVGLWYAFVAIMFVITFGFVIFNFVRIFSGMRNFDRPRKNFR